MVLGGAAGRTYPPAEEALADLLDVPRPQEPTMQEVVASAGLQYEKTAFEAAAVAIGFQERERLPDRDIAMHVRYLYSQDRFVAYDAKQDPRLRFTTRRVTYDMSRGGPAGFVIADETDIGDMGDDIGSWGLRSQCNGVPPPGNRVSSSCSCRACGRGEAAWASERDSLRCG